MKECKNQNSTAKPKEGNLTEFEDILSCAFCEVKTWKDDGNDTPVKEYAKVIAERLLPVARKQFVAEVDTDVLVERFREHGSDSQVDVRRPLIEFVCGCYEHGIKDALLEILKIDNL